MICRVIAAPRGERANAVRRMPCPDCNARADPRDTPKMPPGFTMMVAGKGRRD